jgi:arylsulfatase A-like enzyme
MQVYAMTEYMDSVIGRLMDYVDGNGLLRDTYIFFAGDNGSELFPVERNPKNLAIRMPSKMVGIKKDITEGGNRQFLLVAGPGVPAGATDYTLTSVKDLMSTAISLAGANPASLEQSWRPDGVSIHNLLEPKSQPTGAQEARMLFQIKPDCFWPDFLLQLGPDRYGCQG